MIQSIELPIPPTLNEQIALARTHWSESASAKKQHCKKIAAAAKAQLLPFSSGPIYVLFEWKVKSFARDADNVSAAAKYLMDGLVDAKIIPGDNLVKVPGPWVHLFDRGSDTVKIHLSDSPIVQLEFIQNLTEAEQCA